MTKFQWLWWMRICNRKYFSFPEFNLFHGCVINYNAVLFIGLSWKCWVRKTRLFSLLFSSFSPCFWCRNNWHFKKDRLCKRINKLDKDEGRTNTLSATQVERVFKKCIQKAFDEQKTTNSWSQTWQMIRRLWNLFDE